MKITIVSILEQSRLMARDKEIVGYKIFFKTDAIKGHAFYSPPPDFNVNIENNYETFVETHQKSISDIKIINAKMDSFMKELEPGSYEICGEIIAQANELITVESMGFHFNCVIPEHTLKVGMKLCFNLNDLSLWDINI